MLIGYAIEVILKGLVAARDGSDESLDWMTKSHISMELVKRAKVDLTEADKGLVERTLYHAVRWSGRYPAPTERDAKLFDEQVQAAGGSIFSSPAAVSADFYRQACELYDRLQLDLQEEIAADRRARLRPVDASS